MTMLQPASYQGCFAASYPCPDAFRRQAGPDWLRLIYSTYLSAAPARSMAPASPSTARTPSSPAGHLLDRLPHRQPAPARQRRQWRHLRDQARPGRISPRLLTYPSRGRQRRTGDSIAVDGEVQHRRSFRTRRSWSTDFPTVNPLQPGLTPGLAYRVVP